MVDAVFLILARAYANLVLRARVVDVFGQVPVCKDVIDALPALPLRMRVGCIGERAWWLLIGELDAPRHAGLEVEPLFCELVESPSVPSGVSS
jgi:hypothetical protein